MQGVDAKTSKQNFFRLVSLEQKLEAKGVETNGGKALAQEKKVLAGKSKAPLTAQDPGRLQQWLR